MQPRREVFGLAFIQETVACYKRCVNGDNVNQQELKWAHDVLSKYFLAVAAGKSEVVDGARAMFNDIAAKYSTEKEFSPYSYQSLEKASVSFEQFKQLCVQRRSVRWFKDQPVPRELINQALSAATLAPSACNRQPFEFFVFDKVEEAREIGAIPMGTAGFSHNFQCVLVVVGDLAAYPYERDRHVIYIDGSLASMQLMLALETLGLSSCVINWPDVENLEREMSKKLSLKANQRPLMVLSIGYADDKGMIPYSQKKDVNELVKEVSL
ncbi:nitroreductase family protein [Agarivorans gilvus]|nr:nitroreductase family protein [Agarivorans gilvus]